MASLTRETTSRNPALDPFLARAYERGFAAGREGSENSSALAVKDIQAEARAAGVRTDTIENAYREGHGHGYLDAQAAVKAEAHAAYQAAIEAGLGAEAAMRAANEITRNARV